MVHCIAFPLTGISAAVWPCGIVTLLDELYGAESITQVYGSIHSLLHSNPSHTTDIGECVVHFLPS